MERTTIVAEERVMYRLRRLAAARGVSLGALVREALAEKLERDQPPLSFVGAAGERRPGDVEARVADEDGHYTPDDPRGA